MNKYDKRSATQRKEYIKRMEKLVSSTGRKFIKVERVKTSYYVHFEDLDGQVKRQNVHSFKKGIRVGYKPYKYPKGAGLYKIYIGDELVYLGKTNSFRNRLSDHFNQHKSKLSSYKEEVTKLEVCEMGEADRNVYELYLISKLRPTMNIKDIPGDELSIELPEPEFTEVVGWK